MAVMIPSGQKSDLQTKLEWVGLRLKLHGILTYPSPGYRQLTPLGTTIDESQLDMLLQDTASIRSGAPPLGGVERLVKKFLEDSGYPTVADEEQERLREEWRQKLLPENVERLSDQNLAALLGNSQWGTSDYIARPDLEPTARQADLFERRREDLRRSIEYACWGDGHFAKRLDEVDEHGVRMGAQGDSRFCNVPQSFLCKLLAICHPDRFLPISGLQPPKGRIAMLQRLNLPEPRGDTRGAQIVDANDRLREHLEPYFDDDLYGMATFLYWLVDQNVFLKPSTDGVDRAKPDLRDLAERLLVPSGFLEDIVDLLDDKGQVILYGPPGTGKTYLAQELAAELARDESRRALVQFHPSMSYEDFFEGYRPVGAGDGGIRYELKSGPLARMAERAAEDPDEQHVMVIDEINRGNLPRVLGELLFLLEYRDESVRTLYRPDEPFSLPKNLWFIGTMNTADRSIALVDAALRRRFHFVPFFPDSGPMAGLLGRWLARQGQPAWIGRLVDAVNAELKGDLEGSHLLLGPSHFMKDYGTTSGEQEQSLRRIWEYNIEPFVEDQFFGDPGRIQHYRFAQVFSRHGPTAGSDAAAGLNADVTPATPADTEKEGATTGTGDRVDEASAATEADPQ